MQDSLTKDPAQTGKTTAFLQAGDTPSMAPALLHLEIARQAEIFDALDREIHHDLAAGEQPPEDFFEGRRQARTELARLLSRLRMSEQEDTPLDHEDPWHTLSVNAPDKPATTRDRG